MTKNEKLPEYPKLYWPADEYSWERERANYWESRCRLAVRELKHMAAQDSGKIGSTARADCMAVMAKLVLKAIGPLPDKQP